MSDSATLPPLTKAASSGLKAEEKRVIFASSLGTVFEWYDFYLYAILAPFFASLFFPKGNDTAALLGSFAAYAAGFLVRPFGALVFGRVGDIVGRKYTFLVTITVMGLSTVLVGCLPRFATIGWLAPILLAAPAPAARPGAGRRVRRRRDLRRRAREGGPPRLRHELDPDHGDHRLVHLARRDPRLPQGDVARGLQRLGLADPVPAVGAAADLLALPPAQAGRVTGLQEDQRGGEDLEGAADGSLRPVEQPQDRAPRAFRRDGWSGRGLVHRPVLRAVLPDDHAQGQLRDRLLS